MDTDIYIKMLFGEHALHVPLNLIVQEVDNRSVLVIAQSRWPTEVDGHPLRFGGTHTHQLIMGDAIIRPHMVIGSDHLRGWGATGIITSGFAEQLPWLQHGTALFMSEQAKAQAVLRSMQP